MTFREWREHCLKILEPILGKRETHAVFKIWMQERLTQPFWEWTISQERIIPIDVLSVVYEELTLLEKNYPVQYLPNCCYFLDRPWEVGPGVLIPRQETEELVLWILEHVRNIKNPITLDICTGSGCIPISLQLNNPEIQAKALDISEEALTYAKKNQQKYQTQVQFLLEDWFSFQTDEKFDIIISNPPYIPENEWFNLIPSVKDYEPKLALSVPNTNPLLFYKDIIVRSKYLLKENGKLFFEIHEDFSEDIKDFAESLHGNVEIKKDVFEKKRMILIHF